VAAGGGGFYWPQVSDDFVGSRWRFISLAAGSDRWQQRAAVGFGGQRWIRLATCSSAQWVVVGRRWRLIPLVAACDGRLRRPRVLVDFVGNRQRLVLLLASVGERWLVSVGGGGLGQQQAEVLDYVGGRQP